MHQLINLVLKTPLFYPAWITLTVAAAFGVAWAVGPAVTPKVQEPEEAPLIRKPRRVWSRGAVVAVALLTLLVVGDIVLSLKWEDFAYKDNSYFTLGVLRGHDATPPIWPSDGRFFPLGHQEFNLIRHFTSTPRGYHLLPTIQLLALCSILLILDEELSVAARAGLTALVLVSPAILTSFGALIHPERNEVTWLACLAPSMKYFERTQARVWAVLAVVCAQFMIYYKETAFLLLLGVAVGSLVLRCKKTPGAGWDFERLRDRESRLNVFLSSLAILFVLGYLAATHFHLHQQQNYAHQHGLPTAEVVFAYIKYDLLAWVLVALVLGRVYLLLRHRVPPSPRWDGLALGGVACFAAYLYLGLFSPKYSAPVDFIAVLYVGRFALLSWGQRSWWSKALTMVLLGAVLLQEVALSAFRVYERKNEIHGKAEIATMVKAQYQSGAGHAQRLFFPFTTPYQIMEFAAYLSYRGVPVEGNPDEPAGLGRVAITGRAIARDGPCESYRSVMCHAASKPDPGDLVIILPNDHVSLTQVAPYRERGELLFLYEPRPPIPRVLYPYVDHLRIASWWFRNSKLPDRWLDGSVTVW
jgi:hypothetical protein